MLFARREEERQTAESKSIKSEFQLGVECINLLRRQLMVNFQSPSYRQVFNTITESLSQNSQSLTPSISSKNNNNNNENSPK